MNESKKYKRVDGKEDKLERIVPIATWILLTGILGYFWAHILWWIIR